MPLRVGSFEEWWRRTRALAGPLSQILSSLPEEAQLAIGERAREASRAYSTPAGLKLSGVAPGSACHRGGPAPRRVRLGVFYTAAAHLSPELRARVELAYPDILVDGHLADRTDAFAGLMAGVLDMAIVFEHAFEPNPAPPEVEIVPLFDEPLRVILPPGHRLARRRRVRVADLAQDTWIRAHDGSAARLVDHVLRTSGIAPPIVRAGRGDEPVDSQGLVAAGMGITVTHSLGVWMSRSDILVRRLTEGPVRHVQAALLRDRRAPATLAVLELLRELTREHAQRYDAELQTRKRRARQGVRGPADG
ncbi:MAG TPA: LysR substrate-binding domain-containing protein [Solirubrobacteraceae bacterium]